jgi:hypothetical protein
MKRALIYTKRRKHPNTYEYNAVRNRTKKIVNDGTTTTTTYTYDAADQLTAVNGQAYTYDANGNLTNNGNKTFVYDDDNRLIEVKNASRLAPPSRHSRMISLEDGSAKPHQTEPFIITTMATRTKCYMKQMPTITSWRSIRGTQTATQSR